jgi:hypothetical protein
VTNKRPRWTFQEDRLLEDLYPTLSASELSLVFGRPAEGIRYRARLLGIKAEKRSNLRLHSRAKYERVLALYARMTARDVSQEMGLTLGQVKMMIRNAPSVLA